MNVALALSGADLSLFSLANRDSTLAVLVRAVASATGTALSALAVRRVRDISSPSAPVVLYKNPQFAGDSFASRRLQPQQPRQLSGSGAIAVDVQILLASNCAASALSISLATEPALLAAGVSSSLWSQGSPLAGLQITVTVEPYSDSALVAAPSPNASASPALAAGAAVAATLALAACCLFYYRATHRRAAIVAPMADGASIDSRASMLPQPPPKQRSEAAALQLRTVIEGQDWRSFNREFLTGADMDFLVALGALDADGKRIGAVKMSADVRARFSTVVLDRLVAFGVLGG